MYKLLFEKFLQQFIKTFGRKPQTRKEHFPHLLVRVQVFLTALVLIVISLSTVNVYVNPKHTHAIFFLLLYSFDYKPYSF